MLVLMAVMVAMMAMMAMMVMTVMTVMMATMVMMVMMVMVLCCVVSNRSRSKPGCRPRSPPCVRRRGSAAAGERPVRPCRHTVSVRGDDLALHR